MTPRSNVLMATPEQITQAQRVLDDRVDGHPALFSETPRGARPVPDELGQVLETVLHTLVSGGSFTIETMPEFLTTNQAARLLGESRPTLMKRISSGELGSVMVGSHHRVRASDVVALRKQQFRQRRAEAMEFLALEDSLGL